MAAKGRPRKRAPKSGERVALGLRVTPETKKALDVAAKQSGRSQSQEAEIRIEQTLASERSLLEGLDLAYGPALAGLLLVAAEAMKEAGQHAGFASHVAQSAPKEWWQNPYSFDQAVQAANRIFERLKPGGDASVPPPLSGLAGGQDIGAMFGSLGVGLADGILREIASQDHPPSSFARERGPRLRKALGDTMVERLHRKDSGK